MAIEGMPGGQPAIADLIEQSGLSPGYFHQVFKQCTGLTPCQYRLQFQMSRAKELLHDSSLTVKQIARTVQFSNAEQFVRIFKKKVGLTPTEYRRGGQGTKTGAFSAGGKESRKR